MLGSLFVLLNFMPQEKWKEGTVEVRPFPVSEGQTVRGAVVKM